MKITNILIGGVCMLTLAACNDYLDVDVPSKSSNEDIYTSETETSLALNEVYAKALTDNTFGNMAYNNMLLNSDVDFSAKADEVAQLNAPRRFDCTAESSDTEKFWNALYSGVETANNFIYNLENSEMYSKENANLTQMLGEAKVLRAMFYYELLCYWGDIPFSMLPTYVTQEFILPITSRDEIYKQLIEDLEGIAPLMKTVSEISDGVERPSKEACWAMIARLALQAGGYSLRPADGSKYGKMARPANSQEFYQKARTYADMVIQSGTHALNKEYKQVFIDECNFIVNNNDDVIFELPFGSGDTGQWGYRQGPQAKSYEGKTAHVWGEANGGVQVTPFYRFSFDEKDLRRDYITCFWYYETEGQPAVHHNYTSYNGKWSKLWNTLGLGNITTGATGINFAYLRYSDVLLMFAEAENELNGPTEAAQNALKAVRKRAFSSADHAEKVDAYVATAAASKADFLDAVLDERAWEFAGENMRWKDLVRNNQYAEKLFYTFLRYYSVAENCMTSSSYDDMVSEYDGIYWPETYPFSMFWTYIQNPGDKSLYTNTQLPLLYVVNPYQGATIPQISPENYMANAELPYTPISLKEITGSESASSTIIWNEAAINWMEDAGYPKAQILYSLYGYIRGNEQSRIILNVDGTETNIDPLGYNVNNLPPVRYILPIPREAIARSNGAYTQHCGY
ncbi:MAG: RagB/SusD family nutrient uptake outer membrane protein [Bacteroidaceae bacterium]|nr:RagB/SusD family nutrient uptake outer membrane protein [Bacteroidaceae bacterium]